MKYAVRPMAFLVTVAVATICAYDSILDLGLLGLDTYPMILSGRIQNWHDLLGTFTEQLMDGRYTEGHFYRPVANLSFALDYAIWGLEPKGYHLMDLAILLANAVLLGAVARRLLGGRYLVAPLIAALIFVLHPAQLEVLPVSARRADTLCLLFMLACLVAQPKLWKHRSSLWRGIPGGVLALLAFASKETGIILVALVFVLHFLSHDHPSTRRRIRDSMVISLPTVVAALVFSVVRTFVLGGLGGHGSSPLANIRAVPGLVEPYLGLLLFPHIPRASSTWIAVLSVCLILLSALVWRRSKALVFVSLWLLAVLCISSLSGSIEAWYTMVFLPPYAMLLGILVDRGIDAARNEHYWLALPILCVSLWLCASHVRYSALLHDYTRWQHASDISERFLDHFEERVRSARPGSTIEIESFVQAVAPATESPGVRSAVILTDYSVQAWAELAMPDRPVEVFLSRPSGEPRGPVDERTVHVRLFPGVRPAGPGRR
jgi:hypothetical protein